MKLAYFFDYDTKRGGVFTYALSTLNSILSSACVEKIWIITSRKNYLHIKRHLVKSDVSIVFINSNFIYRYIQIFSCALYDVSEIKPHRFKWLKRFANFINPFNRLIDRLKVDVVHVPSLTSPGYGMKTPLVMTLHDFQELHYPEFFTPYERFDRALHYKQAIDRCDHIIVSFNHVKDDLIKYFNVKEERISICFNSDVRLWHNDIKPTDNKVLIEKYNLPSSFVFYPSKIWEHKNHTNLIYALNILKKKGLLVHLVLTGFKHTKYFTVLNKTILEIGMSDQVHHLGLVSQEDLAGLYKLAKLIVIPTFYEAGSGPLFEAFYYNSPVICSNVTSLPDTMSDDRFIFDPNNLEELSLKIERGLFDQVFREQNLKHIKRRYKELLNIDSGKLFIKAYSLATGKV